jgi:protein arginine kinase
VKLDDLVKKRSESLKGTGPRSEIAISTRVRVARNLKGHLYFSRANERQSEKTLNELISAMKKSRFLRDALFLKMKDVSELDRLFLVERHLMSREHMTGVEHKGLVVEEKEIVSVMLNEEDHIRLQVLQSGFNLMEAWRIIDEVDTDLTQYLEFDFSNSFGYMTSCPTNTGTGLRASVMLHLSALVLDGQIDNVFDAISKLGLTMRGFYGEGTEALGDFFQISNQIALGHSEMDMIDNLERIINKIITREEKTREKLLTKRKEEIVDRVCRAHATLKSARIITSHETVRLMSDIRLGVQLGLLEGLDGPSINEIMLTTQPGHLQKSCGTAIASHERDIKRADLIRERLGEK